MRNILNNLYKNSKKIKIDNTSRIVIMSDCHRGVMDGCDNFAKNKGIYEAVLISYYQKGFSYIELGDGDEMWEVVSHKDIVYSYLYIFKLLKRFYDEGRFIMIYGNHDIRKKSPNVVQELFYKYYDMDLKREIDLLKGICVYESLILNYKGRDIFLIHGHQVDFFNSKLMLASRFVVRYLWKNLEMLGLFKGRTSAREYKVSFLVNRRLARWCKNKKKILIAGHTHRAMYAESGKDLYFNTGSCVYEDGITGIEICEGNITLVKWGLNKREDGGMFVERNVLGDSRAIEDFFC